MSTVYLYKTDDTEIVKEASTFFAAKTALVEAAKAFSEKFSVGRPGYRRCWVSAKFEIGAVHMTREQWNEQYRELWLCPSDDFSTPRRPKKGKESSEVFQEFQKLREMSANPKPMHEALNLNFGLTIPGYFLSEDVLYIESGSPIENEKLTEITQSEMAKAKEQAPC